MKWMDKDMVHIYNGILLSHNKKNHVIGSNMDATRDAHTNWNRSERQIAYAITYMWNLKKGYNEFLCRTEIDRLWKTCGYQRRQGERGSMSWVSGMQML